MRTTIFKKVLNSVLAVSIATTGFVIPTPKYFVHAEEVAVQKVVLSEGFDNYINAEWVVRGKCVWTTSKL